MYGRRCYDADTDGPSHTESDDVLCTGMSTLNINTRNIANIRKGDECHQSIQGDNKHYRFIDHVLPMQSYCHSVTERPSSERLLTPSNYNVPLRPRCVMSGRSDVSANQTDHIACIQQSRAPAHSHTSLTPTVSLKNRPPNHGLLNTSHFLRHCSRAGQSNQNEREGTRDVLHSNQTHRNGDNTEETSILYLSTNDSKTSWDNLTSRNVTSSTDKQNDRPLDNARSSPDHDETQVFSLSLNGESDGITNACTNDKMHPQHEPRWRTSAVPGAVRLDSHRRQTVSAETSDSQHNKWHNLTSLHGFIHRITSLCDIEMCFQPDSDGDSFISLAIIHLKADIVLTILDKVKDYTLLNVPNTDGNTPLHLATIVNMPRVVRKLVVLGCDVTAQNVHGNTALHIASIKGNLECTIALTKPVDCHEVLGIHYHVPYQLIPQDQNILNYDGLACLHLAVKHGNIKTIDHLLYECRADVNIKDGTSGMTILHYAAIDNNWALVDFLLTIRGIDISAQRYDSATPLAIARGRRSERVRRVLQVHNAMDYEHDEDEASDSSDDSCDDSCYFSSGYKNANVYNDIQIHGIL